MDSAEQTEFRYSNRQRYETELRRLIEQKQEEQYDVLVDEYLRFCDTSNIA